MDTSDSDDLTVATARLRALAERFRAVGQQLEAIGREMAAGGEAPDATLGDQIDLLRAEFADVRRAVLNVAREAGDGSPLASQLTSLSSLQYLAEGAAAALRRQAAERTYHAARGVLECIVRLRHRDGGEFPPLAEAQAGARGLLASVSALEAPATHPDVVSLAESRHAFAYLLELAEPPPDLSDARWAFLHDAVAEHFGRALAAAGARGKLVGSNPLDGVDPPPADTENQGTQDEDEWPTLTINLGDSLAPIAAPTVGPAEHGSERLMGGNLNHGVAESTQLPTAADGAEHAPTPARATEAQTDHLVGHSSLDPASAVSQHFAEWRSMHPTSAAPTAVEQNSFEPNAGSFPVLEPNPAESNSERNSVQSPAVGPHLGERNDVPLIPDRCSGERNAVEPNALDTLIWRALLVDRPGTAFLLASSQHRQPVTASTPPAWLLRAVALSRQVLYVNGDLALQLNEDFAQFDAGRMAGVESDEVAAAATRLLLTAAALRPSLVAPDTASWTILDAWSTDPTFPVLQRYARVVSEYGRRHPPFSPYTFTPELSPNVWRDALEDLLRDIGAWRVRFLGMRPSFPPAREVWRSWLRPDGLIHTLLAPLSVDPRGLEAARGLAERLSNRRQIDWEIAHTDRSVLGRVGGPDISTQVAATTALHQRVAEAIDFSRRWIALQENRPGRPDDEPRKLAKYLRQELSELRPGVDAELNALDVSTAPLPTRGAVVQCRAALASVDALFGAPDVRSNSRSLSYEEPPPGLVLYADLLRVPGASLDAEWCPSSLPPMDDGRGAQAILAAVEESSWQQAFEAHLHRHDHLATAQVLECMERQGITAHSPDLTGLRSARLADLERCCEHLHRQVELTRHAIDASAARGSLGARDRARFLAAVEPIAVGLPTIVQFEPLLDRMQGIREELREEHLTHHVNPGTSHGEVTGGSAAGRDRQGLAIAAMDGPCLLVGRPGMGTSDMLRSVADLNQAPDQGRVALVIDLAAEAVHAETKTRLVGASVTDRFWHLLAAAARANDVIGQTASEHIKEQDTLQAVQTWLQADPARWLLILVDCADGLLQEETLSGTTRLGEARLLFPTSSRLMATMQASHGRVKFVLAGSLGVLRASRLAQYPFASRGCVHLAPLLDDGDWQLARPLIRHACADVESASPDVDARILGLANYEPETIRRFAGLLAERCRGTTITVEALEEQLARPEVGRLLSGTLRATTAGDPRFGVVVYSLALAYWRGEVDATVSRDWLREQAVTWWEKGFHHTWSEDTFGELLDEMVQLQLLYKVDQERFTPGQPNLIEFLGSQEDLMRRLSEYRTASLEDAEAEYEYPPTWFRPKLRGDTASRSPLTAQQASAALGPPSGCAIVFGTPASQLFDLEQMEPLIGQQSALTLHPPRDAPGCEELIQMLRAEIEGPDAPQRVLLVPPGWTWNRDWVWRVQEYLETERTHGDGYIRVVFVADPAATARLVETSASDPPSSLTSLKQRGVRCLTLAPWRKTVALQWLADAGWTPDAADASELSLLTGNWPLLVASYVPDRRESLESGKIPTDELTTHLAAGADGPLGPAFGLDQPIGKVLREFCAGGNATDIELDSNTLPPCLEWASLLHLIHPVGGRRWRLDPVAARLLSADQP